jgi:hypothetical protein
MPAPVFKASDLALELLDPGSLILLRLFRPARQADGDWEPPDPKYRNQRVDPPAGQRDRYAVLYTADSLPCVAAECRILRVDPSDDDWTWRRDLAQQYQVVRYAFAAPAVVLPIDHPNARPLGLAGGDKTFNRYAPFQEVALAVFERYGSVLHGLSWSSFHRNQLGRVYAIWHHHKATLQLSIAAPKPYPSLAEDPDWLRFLAANPDIEPITA